MNSNIMYEQLDDLRKLLESSNLSTLERVNAAVIQVDRMQQLLADETPEPEARDFSNWPPAEEIERAVSEILDNIGNQPVTSLMVYYDAEALKQNIDSDYGRYCMALALCKAASRAGEPGLNIWQQIVDSKGDI